MSDKSDEIFEAKIKNIVNTVKNKNYPKHSLFLDDSQVFKAKEILKQLKCENFLFYGGYDNAQRVMLGVYPDYMSSNEVIFPITAIEFSYPKAYELKHKDFLGALMSLQIKRETLGDIIVSSGKTIVFAQNVISEFILQNLTKVGNVGIKAKISENADIIREENYKQISGSVSSLRIDCILALITHKSRTQNAYLISSHTVFVNYKEVKNQSMLVKPGDIITVRGFGKHILSDEIKRTKKDRYHITLKKFV